MSKKYLVIFIVLVILVLAGGVYYWQTKLQKPALVAVVSPVVSSTPVTPVTSVNPLESAQSANPYDKTNPFANIKVNPFE